MKSRHQAHVPLATKRSLLTDQCDAIIELLLPGVGLSCAHTRLEDAQIPDVKAKLSFPSVDIVRGPSRT
jgi:hypothetical protein